MASIIIWHNPKCGTSRTALALLQEAGHDIGVIEYLKTPPDAATLAQVAAAVGGARALLRRNGTSADERGHLVPSFLESHPRSHPLGVDP